MHNSTNPHIIRLRKPWKKTVEGSVESSRIDVPEPFGEESLATAIYERPFNQPTGLQGDSRVLLRIESWIGAIASLTVNETQLVVAAPPAEIDITSLLEKHNKLMIQIRAENDVPPRLSGAITLAIH